MTAVMRKIHYVRRSPRRQANHAGSRQRPYAGARCTVSTRKGPKYVKDVPFTYIFMYYVPNHPLNRNPAKIQDDQTYSAAICLAVDVLRLRG